MSVQGTNQTTGESPLEIFQSLLERGEEIQWYIARKPINMNRSIRSTLIISGISCIAFILILICELIVIIHLDFSDPLYDIYPAIPLLGTFSSAISIKKAIAPRKLLDQMYSREELNHYIPAIAITTQHLYVKQWPRKLHSQELHRQVMDIEIWPINALVEVYEKITKLRFTQKKWIFMFFLFPNRLNVPIMIPPTTEVQFKEVLKKVRSDLEVRLWVGSWRDLLRYIKNGGTNFNNPPISSSNV